MIRLSSLCNKTHPRMFLWNGMIWVASRPIYKQNKIIEVYCYQIGYETEIGMFPFTVNPTTSRLDASLKVIPVKFSLVRYRKRTKK
jgi:hypothetical protein